MAARRLARAFLAFAVAAATVASPASGSASGLATGTIGIPSVVTASGTVRDDIVDVTAPILVQPQLDVTVGIDRSRQPTPPGIESTVILNQRARAASSGSSARSGASRAAGSAVAGRLATVTVREGDRVSAGQVVAVFDTTLLRLDVTQAVAAKTKAQADIRVIDARLDDLATKREQALTARRQIISALAKIPAARTALQTKLAQLRAVLALLTSGGGRPPGGIPGGVPTGTVPPGGLPTGTVPPGGIPTGTVPPGGLPTVAQVRAGIAQIQAGLAQMAAGEAKARTGLATIDTALSKLADARTALRNARKLAVISAGARGAAVTLAHAQVRAATLRAPVDGIVVQALRPGEIVMTSAPVVRIRPLSASRIDVYLAPEQMAGITTYHGPANPMSHGVDNATIAYVTADWAPGRSWPARVTEIAPVDDYPPAGVPTGVVHLVRAFRVTVTVNPGLDRLPAGTWTDLRIYPR